MISLDFLENVEAFSDLDDDQLTAIQGCCEIAEFKRGEEIFAAGETPEYFWVVLEGQVNLTWDAPEGPHLPENTITTLSEGMPFGWSSLVPPYKYHLSAHCASRNCKTVKRVSVGMSLHVRAYNLKRVMNIMETRQLFEAMQS